MTTPVFTWSPLVQPTGTVTLRVLKAQFGDGYAQTSADGINNNVQSWPLTFSGTSAEVTPIKAFLDGQQGYLPFLWTPPLGVQGYYKCASYTIHPVEGDVYTLTATFMQDFQP